MPTRVRTFEATWAAGAMISKQIVTNSIGVFRRWAKVNSAGGASTTSAYGAAGAFVALLLWVYYSAQILFLGAEFTQVYASEYGSKIQPAEDAVVADAQHRKAERPDGPFGTVDARQGIRVDRGAVRDA